MPLKIKQKTLLCEVCHRISPDDRQVRHDRHINEKCDGKLIDTVMIMDYETEASQLLNEDETEVLVMFAPDGTQEMPIPEGPLN